MGTRVQTIVLYRGRNAHGESRKHDEQTHLTGRSIGLSIVGGIDSPRGPMGIFVKTLYANGLAAQSGLIHKGDEIVSVNGIELFGKTHAEALHVFKMFSKVDVTLVIRRATLTYYHVNLKATDKSRIEEIYGNQGEVAVSDAAPLADDSIAKTTLRVERHDVCNIDGYFLDYVTEHCDQMRSLQNVVVRAKRALDRKTVGIMREKILLEKSFPEERLGLGIAVESDDNSECVLSVRVEQVEPNSVAYKSGLRVGDRIWYVAGKDVHTCSRQKCLALFHQSSTKVVLVISRHKPALLQKRAGRCNRTTTESHTRPQNYSEGQQQMALQLDALSASSGMMPSSNGVLNGAPSHSPLSSDSGFHSDQIGAEQQQQQRTAPPLRTKNIFHKPTYDSVFATDPDTNTIFDKFDRRFQTNRPHCLSNPLRFPKSDDENRSKSPVAAPVIVPTRLTMSTGSRTPTSPFYTASSTSRECDSLANFSLPSPHQQSHESLLHQDSGSSEERFMSSSITESFASGTAAALKQQPPALPHEPPPSAPTSTQYITSTNVSIQLSPTSASYNHPSPPVSPLKPKLSLQTTARTPDLPTMTITLPGATLSTAAVIGEIPHHVLAYNDEEIATAELVDYAINSSEQVSQSAHEVMVERETERSAEHKLKLIEEGEDMTELKDRVDSKEALVEAVEEEQEPSELLGRDSELSYCKSIKETPSPAFGEHVQLTSFARSTGFARPDVEYEHADAKLDKTAEYPNIAPAHEDSSTANFGTKSSSVNLSSPSFGAAKFSSWSINKVKRSSHQTSPLPNKNYSAPSSPSILAPLKSYSARHSSTASELSAAPRRYMPNLPSSSPPSAPPTSPPHSSYIASRRSVPVNELIEKFSQNDNGAPVMPAPRGVAAMVHSSVPSSYSRTSTSTRGLRTSEWRISSSTASANLPQSPPPRFTAVTSSSYGSLSQKSDDSSNLHETSPPKVVSSSHENPSVRVTALHWSSQESLPKAITVASSSEECPEQKATSIPSNLHENPPSRGGISTLPRLTSPVKSTFSSEASSPITRSSDVQFEKNHTSPRYSFRNEFDETNTLSYPYTSVDSKDPMMTINKQSPVETFAEHSEVASARTFESSYQSDRRNIARPNTIAQQVLSSASVPTQSSVLPPNDSASKQRSSFVGLDFSRYEVAEEDIIGRPVEADESEQNAILFAKEFYSKSAACSRGKPTEQQLAQCKEILGSESFADYDIFTVNLKRSANSPEGSVGIILTSAATGDKYILVQKVITGSIADHSDYIDRGDRVFFIQDRSTRMMTTSEARALMKSPAPMVSLVLGRLHSSEAFTFSSAPLELFSTVSIDPDRFHYSPKAEEIVLTKGSLGVGLALDGGRGSVYGDRPIVVKRIFEGGSAAKSGRIKVGDQVIAIDDVSTKGMSYLEATKTLRSRPEGPVKISIYSRV